jgi:hypothetical protein
MDFKLNGTVIVKNETQVISDKFKKREFVIEKKETSPNGYEFVDTIKFQLLQDKCNVLDAIAIGDEVTVSFNVKGNKWEKDGKTSYFVNLDAWRIDKLTAAPPPTAPTSENPTGLPF